MFHAGLKHVKCKDISCKDGAIGLSHAGVFCCVGDWGQYLQSAPGDVIRYYVQMPRFRSMEKLPTKTKK